VAAHMHVLHSGKANGLQKHKKNVAPQPHPFSQSFYTFVVNMDL